MISYIRGELAEILGDIVVLESGMVGFNIRVPGAVLSSLPPIGTEMKLYTYLYVREDAMSLFGFLSRDDLNLFKQLLGVNGVGPKAALGILSVISPNDFRFAVLAGDAKAISRAPGIGAKTAQKIILELKDRITLEEALEQGQVSHTVNRVPENQKQEAVLALTALGYSNTEALKALSKVKNANELSVEQLLKAALKNMAIL
ncbi:MAG: Holliday junction branch migration protein RuvA [Clostridiales bacterium]|nr:Holliday junction branch migration protein RuvA [Clostridiales bacterium]